MTDTNLLTQVEQVITSLLPMVHRDGGDIKVVKVEAGVVYVKLFGACVGCPASMYTLKLGLEASLKEKIPSITEVIAL